MNPWRPLHRFKATASRFSKSKIIFWDLYLCFLLLHQHFLCRNNDQTQFEMNCVLKTWALTGEAEQFLFHQDKPTPSPHAPAPDLCSHATTSAEVLTSVESLSEQIVIIISNQCYHVSLLDLNWSLQFTSKFWARLLSLFALFLVIILG